MLVTAPMPVLAALCGGILPPGMLLIWALSLLILGEVLYFIIALAFTALPFGILYFLSHFYVKKILAKGDNFNQRRFVITCIALLTLGLVPMYGFDCIDSHGAASCNAYHIYYGLYSKKKECGDFF
jgi:hypothetical protein